MCAVAGSLLDSVELRPDQGLDLRHAAVSLWLNGGVPPTEVAARAGHSVGVLLRVYAKCVYEERERVNRKIDGLYGDDPA